MARETPILSYAHRRLPGEEEEEGARDAAPVRQTKVVLDVLFRGITWGILLVILAVWLVVGVVFWVPWVLRATFLYLISLIESTFEGTQPTDAARVLKDAVSFYKRGFLVAFETVLKEDLQGDEVVRPEGGRLMFEMLWAALVWYTILLLGGWVTFSPLDFWHWLASVPWGEAWHGALGWVRGLRG